MKKGIITLAILCIAVGMMAQERVKGAHPYKVSENENASTEFSHWSLTPHIGFSYFDGDFNTEMKHAISYPTAGLDLEYSFNPVWGLGVEYMFDRYGVTGSPKGDNASVLLQGYMHKAGVYVSMDFVGLFYPKARKKICGVEAILGGGYAWYKRNIYYPDSTRYHTGTLNPGTPDTKYNGELYLQAGLNVEFNLNRTMALGVRATYNYFINDYLDGRGYQGIQSLASKNNDGIVDVTLNMRFKLMGVSKTHMRNVAGLEWSKEKEDKKKQCHDTVIIRHDSIIVREYKETNETTIKENESNYYYVYFDNAKDNIKEDGLITIQQVADRLAEDTALYAVVTGFCDNTGSNSLNYALGDRRAANVMDELREEHGVSDSHMYAMGMGKLIGRRSQAAYGPNRRAVIRLVDKETFERMKLELDEKKALREADAPAVKKEEKPAEPVKTVPIAESSRPEKVNTFAKRSHEEATTQKETTLSKLARKYYNNTHCWVYIYIANKDRLPNPNALEPGMKLVIPELTEEEMRITKDQCLRMYYNARQGK